MEPLIRILKLIGCIHYCWWLYTRIIIVISVNLSLLTYSLTHYWPAAQRGDESERGLYYYWKHIRKALQITVLHHHQHVVWEIAHLIISLNDKYICRAEKQYIHHPPAVTLQSLASIVIRRYWLYFDWYFNSVDWWIASSATAPFTGGNCAIVLSDLLLECCHHSTIQVETSLDQQIIGSKSNWIILRHVTRWTQSSNCDWLDRNRSWRALLAVMQRVNILIGQVNAANVPPSIHPYYQYKMRDNITTTAIGDLLSFHMDRASEVLYREGD